MLGWDVLTDGARLGLSSLAIVQRGGRAQWEPQLCHARCRRDLGGKAGKAP